MLELYRIARLSKKRTINKEDFRTCLTAKNCKIYNEKQQKLVDSLASWDDTVRGNI